jgi:hypothetical protein
MFGTMQTRQLLRQVAVHWVCSRAIFLLGFVLGTVLGAPSGPPGSLTTQDAVLLPTPTRIWAALTDSAVHYSDFGWYSPLAANGYDTGPFDATTQHNWAFFPAQAVWIELVRTPSTRLLIALLVSAVAAALIALVIADSFDLATARQAMPLMLYFPFSFVLSQFRPENLVLFFTALALVMLRPGLAGAWRGAPWIAAAALTALGFCKPNSFLVSILLLPLWHAANSSARRWALVALATLPAVGPIALSVWMYRLNGHPLAWAEVQAAWGAKPILALADQFRALWRQPAIIGRWGWDATLLNWIVAFAAWLSVALLLRRRQFAAALFVLLTSTLSLLSFGVWVHGKHLAPVYPMFAGLGGLDESPDTLTAVVALLAAFLALAGFLNAVGVRALLA